MQFTSTARRLRFAFDLGTNSIGWAVLTVDDTGASSGATGLIDCGVRIFDDSRDPKDEKPLGEKRRGPRGARRRRDRFLMRRKRLMQMLIGFDLLPTDHKARSALIDLDPYRLRAEALDRKLGPHEIGRILIHLNQRRGFKSNRKTDPDDDKEKGKIASAAERLAKKIDKAGARTFGEFLWKRHSGPDGKATPRTRQSVRIRLEGEGREELYAFYPMRAMLEAEFDAIMANQQQHHDRQLTDERISLLRGEMFHQRPLKAPKRGKCTFISTQERLPKALPSVEARIIYEAVNNLRFGVGVRVNTQLTPPQRDEIVKRLLEGKNVTEAQLRKSAGAPADVRFQIAAGEVNGLKDYVAESAKKLAADGAFGAAWHDLSLAEKDAIVWKLIGEDDDDAIREWLHSELKLPPDAAQKVACLSFRVGTARLGATANAAVLAQLMAPDVPTYSEAVKRAGDARGETWHHSDIDNPEPREFLPYYAQVLDRQVLPGTDAPGDDPYEAHYGRIANPTVHRCLRQLQKLVNALIRRHGRPAQIVIEVARDLKLGEKQKAEHRRTNKKNRDANDARRSELEKAGKQINADALLRLRLYDEQARAGDGIALCPYSLKPIVREDVLSDRVEIDHILPYSRTLDDSPANKVVCLREANREKRTLSPHEAFGGQDNWAEIEARARLLPPNKRWRFAEDAMERFENEERGFAARQLNETRYISKLARAYLTVIAGKGNVYVTTGHLTAMLRRRWGLNAILRGDNQPDDEPARKVRDDHRHHAIDAIVVGAIDRPLLNEVSRRAGQFEGEGRDWRITDAAPEEPFPEYAETAKKLIRQVIVSRKPDHGKGGALHEETAYGFVRGSAEAGEIGNLVTRKPLTNLSAKEVDSIRDRVLRAELQAIVAPYRDDKGKVSKDNEKDFKAALEDFSQTQGVHGREQGVRRVRIGKVLNDFIPVANRTTGAVYKALIPGENHHIDIVQMRDGKWKGFAATLFEVNQKGWRPVWEREKMGGKLVMRVHKGDVIELDHNGKRKLMSVHRLEISSKRLRLAEHFEGGQLDKRKTAGEFNWMFRSFEVLRKNNARLVHVDILGKVLAKNSNID
ncbi:MAG: type II CRISPR RNA-guided endonuclease Cas9 [Alphaproteobacteria bacterium]|nr:type II CRISPR RNA-guided endonuclease Cas9 [Alphaproteobacteria bacterium]